MQIRKKWQSYKNLIDLELGLFFQRQYQEVASFDPEIQTAWKHLEKVVVSSGKRLRPFLFLWSANLKESEQKKIIPVAVSLELIHSYFLIHDDIIDRDLVRHGVETLHETYRKKWNKFEKDNSESLHFGNGIALLLGDWLFSMALGNIFTSDLPNKQKTKISREVISLVNNTIYGETLDVMTSLKQEYSLEEFRFKALEVIKTKTAYYTFIAPFKLGVIIGEKTKEEGQLLEKVGMEMGKIYQWQDDILGIFEEEKKLGKPSGSDLRENKPTLLIIETLKGLNGEEKNRFISLLGRNLKKNELEKARNLIEKSGAREKLEKMIKGSADNLIKLVRSSRMKESRKEELVGIMEMVVGREK